MTSVKPVIAILGGTGNEGPGLALRWAGVGYKVIIGSRSTEKAKKTASRLNGLLGIDSIDGLQNSDAVRSADICVLTVVQTAHQTALIDLKDKLQGKILVDSTARVDFRNPKPPDPPSSAEIAQQILGPGVRVVAAFQNVPAHELKNLAHPISSEVLVCADDKDAAEMVIQLAQDGGMKAYFAGSLINASTVEGLTAILINMNKYYKSRSAGIKIVGI